MVLDKSEIVDKKDPTHYSELDPKNMVVCPSYMSSGFVCYRLWPMCRAHVFYFYQNLPSSVRAAFTNMNSYLIDLAAEVCSNTFYDLTIFVSSLLLLLLLLLVVINTRLLLLVVINTSLCRYHRCRKVSRGPKLYNPANQ